MGALREKNKGRASGGIIAGAKESLEEKVVEKKIEGMQEKKVKIKEKWYRMTIYNGKAMKKTRKEIEKYIKEEEKENLIIGGDWNARTGRRGIGYHEGEYKERKSEDKTLNNEGKKLIKMV